MRARGLTTLSSFVFPFYTRPNPQPPTAPNPRPTIRSKPRPDVYFPHLISLLPYFSLPHSTHSTPPHLISPHAPPCHALPHPKRHLSHHAKHRPRHRTTKQLPAIHAHGRRTPLSPEKRPSAKLLGPLVALLRYVACLHLQTSRPSLRDHKLYVLRASWTLSSKVGGS